MPPPEIIVGIDVGGTFTDAVVFDAREERLLSAFKLPSTPDDPGRAVVEAVDRIRTTFSTEGSLVCHGTTVGTNTLIERRGARTALLATRGFTDVVELRRQARPRLYEFAIEVSEPLVPAELRVGVDERMDASGSVVRSVENVQVAIAELRRLEVEAVAVSFLHAYANAEHEEQVMQAIRVALPDVYVTTSSDICPEYREYERTSTVVVNAYIGPVVSRYMIGLNVALSARGVARLMVVKSNGGLTSPENAGRYPVHLIESGPAAGLSAASAYARASGRRDLIAFDMGGTTAKAGLIRNGDPETSPEFYADRLVEGRDVGGYAIRSPILDLVEIGAGGGSIARIDEAGVLKVGPRSAGAVPGPACYGRGGELPTVTDAHAVVGTLNASLFEGSGVAFNPARAEEAIRRHVAEPFGWSTARAAYAIIDIAVANMAEMVRLATVQRGLDPREYAMLASGGAGPLHAALVAREIGIPTVVVPPYPGMFSALGATLGRIRHEVVQTILRKVDDLDQSTIDDGFAVLTDKADRLLADEPAGAEAARYDRFVDTRFAGQLFELRLPFGAEAVTPDGIERAFRAAYRSEYGIDLESAAVQVVSVRIVATRDLGIDADGLLSDDRLPFQPARSYGSVDLLARDGSVQSVPFVSAETAAGTQLDGPAIIAHQGSTIWLQDRQTASISSNGQVLIAMGQHG